MTFRQACGVLLALFAATATTASAQARTVPLDAFTAIEACLPFNFAVSPSKGTTYQMIIDADTGVAAAINASVTNGVLSLALADNQPNSLTFKANNPIKVAVQLPADQLASVAVASIPSVTVAVASGFSVPSFSASITGTSTLSVQGLTAEKGEFINAGLGTLYVSGKLQSVLASSSSTGSVYVLGVSQSAAVDASGISKIYIGGTPQTRITGQVSGISSVLYNQGVCSVTSQFGIFGSPCTQQAFSVPTSLKSPQWSCALTIYGTFGCSDGTTSSSSSTPATPAGTSSSSSSTSGGGTGTTYTSQTINGVTTTSTGSSSPDGTSSLTTTTGTLQMGSCATSGSALNMFASS
ncbi:hypothetical protein WJX73_009707 [Symbiochloris irregularis]|uniref:Putative auto-transporter adhesin head GIN domain-containing protein n=1 Tax=Symbiochloris irregularis TaxID=706552 RepID=A0AAW1P5P5_9CHLO